MGEVVERKDLSFEEVKNIINEFPLELFGNRVLITVNSEQTGELTLTDNVLSEEQYVVAVGPMAERFVQAGDRVILDLDKLMSKKPVAHDQYQMEEVLDLKPFVVGENTFAMINDNQIKARYKNV
jgi:hypothetical protein